MIAQRAASGSNEPDVADAARSAEGGIGCLRLFAQSAKLRSLVIGTGRSECWNILKSGSIQREECNEFFRTRYSMVRLPHQSLGTGNAKWF
jgi:hypothetical protein